VKRGLRRISALGRPQALLVVAASVGVALVLGAGAAVVCSTHAVRCYLRPTPEWKLEYVLGQRGGPLTLPPALRSRVVANGLEVPTDFDFLPDGRVVVATQAGAVRVVEGGRVSPTPLLDLRGRVGTWVFRGLVAIAVDRSASPVELYVAYAVAPEGPGSDPSSDAPTTVRFSRFTVVDDVADLSSEQVIVGKSTRGSCFDRPVTADCIPSDRDHIGADIILNEDGTLFLSTGDGGGSEPNVTRSQHLDSLAGKVLRVDRSGRGLPGNPYWNGDPSANRSKVWASGFRNPFRMTVTARGDLIVGDVGLDHFEELDIVELGADYGWPCFEGTRKTPKFRSIAFCGRYYRREARRAYAPWRALPHDTWGSLTGGVDLSGATELPEVYRSKYVFGDWMTSTLWVVDTPVRRDRRPLSFADPEMVGSGLGGPVRMRVGPDGALYALALNVGELRRIVRAGS
jgi:glucose/arabinose dehydrogenase